MHNPRLAHRYAKSLIDLATERGSLEKVFADVQYLQAVCKQSRDFVLLLKSPIIKADKKQQIIKAVTEDKVSELTLAFVKLLTGKGREFFLPEIVEAFIAQYNEIKNIYVVKLTTAVDISDDVKQSITSRLQKETAMQNIQLQTEVKEELIGGFVLEFNNNLVDASVARDLNDIRKQFAKNDYIHNIR